jgi:hypothetical protein
MIHPVAPKHAPYRMAFMRKFPVFVVAAMLLAGCMGTPEPESAFQPSPVADVGSSPETPIDQRISDVLQEAKQQYDDRHYSSSFRYAQQAEALIAEHGSTVEDEAMALTIQGYCLLQLGRVDDYTVKTHGRQEGAVSKFRRAIAVRKGDFRSQLGIALAQYRRHGDGIRKAEALGDGVVALESIREDFRRAMNGDKRSNRLSEVSRRLQLFKKNRTRLIELGYIFRDPNRAPRLEDGTMAEAPWLGSLTESESILALSDMEFILQDAQAGAADSDDIAAFRNAALSIADNWRQVRRYWRKQALADLQDARDRLLEVRKKDETLAVEMGRMAYFWVDRDLAFVFQSLGAFFLDSALENARMQAIAEGMDETRLEARAREIFLQEDFEGWEKTESRRNYQAALSYTKSFVERHTEFEKLRLRKVRMAEESDENNNPFLVDLVARYRATMDEMVNEERRMRAQMVLEAAALCIDPIFQINDLRLAIVWSNTLKGMNPTDPIYLFVAATAYFQAGEWASARDNYEGFMQASSITRDTTRRQLARRRITQCEQQLSREAGAGEDTRER